MITTTQQASEHVAGATGGYGHAAANARDWRGGRSEVLSAREASLGRSAYHCIEPLPAGHGDGLTDLHSVPRECANDSAATIDTDAVLVGGVRVTKGAASGSEWHLNMYSHRRSADDCASELASLSDVLCSLQGSISVRLVNVDCQASELRPSLRTKVQIVPGNNHLAAVDQQARTQRVRVIPRGQLSPCEVTIIRILSLLSKGADVGDVATAVKTDPGLQYRLLQYLNSAHLSITSYGGFRSFEHAIMLVGYKQMTRWLSLFLLRSAVAGAMPEAYRLAVARGRQMEHLGLSSGIPAGERDALFLTGVFSYLDKVLSEPIAEILASLALDADIRDALVSGTGRYAPILNFARSTEGESEVELYRHFTMLSISPSAANRAIVEGIIFADESCRED